MAVAQLVVGATPRIRKNDRQRFETIKLYCGCLPCLLVGHLDRHTSIEHVTDAGFRIGKDSSQHEASVGLCMWHHYGRSNSGQQTQRMIGEFGPSLAHGRTPFEEFFGDEVNVLIPVQDFLLQQFADKPWPEYHMRREVAQQTRNKWIDLNANARSYLPPRNESD